jgi:hypothetical protein
MLEIIIIIIIIIAAVVKKKREYSSRIRRADHVTPSIP